MIKEQHTYAMVLAVFLASVCAFVFMRGCDKKKDSNTASPSLPSNDVEKLIINPDTHRITVITPGREETLFLPDRPSSIEINKQGKVSVTSSQFGTEIKPFVGALLTNYLRVGVGVDTVYYKKLDLGFGIADRLGKYVPVGFVKLSYTVYSNSQLGLTYDSSSHVGLSLTVRL